MNKFFYNGLKFKFHKKDEIIKIYLNWIENLL